MFFGNNTQHKFPRLNIYTLCLSGLIIGAIGLRLALIMLNWPVIDSDESYMNLLALHIAYKGELPIFYYGQNYMGVLEGYIGALCIRLWGLSYFTVRIGLVLIYASFLMITYFLLKLLYSRNFALAMIALFSLGSSDIFQHQLKAFGGYPEMLPLTALIFLVTAHLTISNELPWEKLSHMQQRRRRRAYGILGLLFGFAFYTHPLMIVVIAVATGFLVLICHAELRNSRTRNGLFLLAGILLALIPFFIFNIQGLPRGETTLSTLIGIQNSGAHELAIRHLPRIQQFIGALLISFPVATGLSSTCSLSAFPYFAKSGSATTSHAAVCIVGHTTWTIGYIILLIGALLFFGRAVFPFWQQWCRRGTEAVLLTIEQRRKWIKAALSIALLLMGILFSILYIMNPANAFDPFAITRYLTCLVLVWPCLLWPFWHYLAGLLQNRKERKNMDWWQCGKLIGSILILSGVFTTFALGPLYVIPKDIQSSQRFHNQQMNLIRTLQYAGIQHLYTDYWTCSGLIFRSNEHIICMSIDKNFKPESIRYPEYEQVVKKDPEAAYVFNVGSETGRVQRQKFIALLNSKRHQYLQIVSTGPYVIYQQATK